ncbi:MAG: nuclear transport factor 2 family protein [Candidatus Eremiobacteraeota bacterium]|nr:nuclear transport factor 2 family protein [Candidatus Eremiobacteraeota bacterium]MBC5827385.1 nuclear transport factor 2 family protein [Candidatus Eremiobacteraeota bacterium]
MPARSSKETAEEYFTAWKIKDFSRLKAILDDDVTFVGPLGRADGAEACVRGLTGLSQMLTDVVIEKMFVDGADVATWFNLHTQGAPACPTVNWSHVENGKITRIRVTFDPRPLIGK